jgi:hypothetical protein
MWAGATKVFISCFVSGSYFTKGCAHQFALRYALAIQESDSAGVYSFTARPDGIINQFRPPILERRYTHAFHLVAHVRPANILSFPEPEVE